MNVIITGASKGIGKAVAKIFAANGHNIYLCSRGEATLYKTVEELMTKYPAITIKAKPFDLSKKEEAIAFLTAEKISSWLVDSKGTNA